MRVSLALAIIAYIQTCLSTNFTHYVATNPSDFVLLRRSPSKA
ncbi:MAG: hypothetical protein F4058_06410 [Rhodothermaceae bacterium]|nr:hypothetical protein [Rhodothermaceae bacterium]MYI84956.1 hypothetical protein [Rhodothermaceae bacterium]